MTSDAYRKRSFGEVAITPGEKPGIVVVDFQTAFTDPSYPLGGAALVLRALENTAKLLEAARRFDIPVVNSTISYTHEREMPYWKIKAVRETFFHDHPGSQFDARIYDPNYDVAVRKTAPSIFFGTSVSSYFNKERVDTVIVTGCNTSGCIRATAVDSFSYRYRTLVPEDCVGDVEEEPHQANLRDMDRRYVDVTDLARCLDYFRDWHRRNRR